MTYTGTSHFISRKKAEEYYAPLGFDSQDVEQKIGLGEIIIGQIPLEWNGYFNPEGRFMRMD